MNMMSLHQISAASDVEISHHDPGITQTFTTSLFICVDSQTHTHTAAGLNQIECILILFLHDQGGLENSRAALTTGTLKPNKYTELLSSTHRHTVWDFPSLHPLDLPIGFTNQQKVVNVSHTRSPCSRLRFRPHTNFTVDDRSTNLGQSVFTHTHTHTPNCNYCYANHKRGERWSSGFVCVYVWHMHLSLDCDDWK